MVRAFGRKSESGSTRFSVGEDSGWFDGSTSNETSPGSLWGLNDETRFRNENDARDSSEQDLPTEQDHYSPNYDEVTFSADESDWWSQPNLMEQSYEHSIQENSPELTATDHSYELTDEERPIDTLELPMLVLPTPNFDDSLATEDDADETTLVTNVPSFTSAPEDDEAITIVPADHQIKPRPRVLNESTVLPHEASFATVSLYQTAPRSYSPGKEFGAKIVSGFQRSLPVLLLAAVCSAVIFFSVKYKSTLFDSPAEEQIHRTQAPIPSSAPSETAAAPANPTTVPVASSNPAPPAVERVGPPAVAISKPANTKQQPSEIRRPAASASANRPAKSKSENNTKVETPKAAPKPPAEAPAVPTGGGERPRRVNSQASASKT